MSAQEQAAAELLAARSILVAAQERAIAAIREHDAADQACEDAWAAYLLVKKEYARVSP